MHDCVLSLGRERQQKHIMSNSPTFPVSLLFMAPFFAACFLESFAGGCS